MATLPFLYKLAEKRPDWLTIQTIADMIAVSESTPGPIGINMATYAGYQVAELRRNHRHARRSRPSIIIVIIAKFLAEFDKNPLVKHAFYGLRAAVVGLITFALLKLLSVTLLTDGAINYLNAGLYLVFVALVLIFKKAHPLIWILLGALIGLMLGLPS